VSNVRVVYGLVAGTCYYFFWLQSPIISGTEDVVHLGMWRQTIDESHLTRTVGSDSGSHVQKSAIGKEKEAWIGKWRNMKKSGKDVQHKERSKTSRM
jgi:hypothetical protein